MWSPLSTGLKKRGLGRANREWRERKIKIYGVPISDILKCNRERVT